MDSMNSAHSAITRDHDMSSQKQKEEHVEYKKLEWLSMKTRMTALVEKADVSNVELVADQILDENIIRGKGLFCQAVMESQSKSPESTDVYAALVALINSISPQVGYLLAKRAVLQFREAHGSGDKKRVLTAASFLAQLVNQRVVCEYLPVTLFMLMLAKPTSDNVEVAARFCIQCGALLTALLPHKMKEFLGEFRRLLRKGRLKKRVQLLIVRLFAKKKRKFEACGGVIDVVDDEDQVTHDVTLLQDVDPETGVDEFHQISEADEQSRQLMVPRQDFDDDEVSSTAPHARYLDR